MCSGTWCHVKRVASGVSKMWSFGTSARPTVLCQTQEPWLFSNTAVTNLKSRKVRTVFRTVLWCVIAGPRGEIVPHHVFWVCHVLNTCWEKSSAPNCRVLQRRHNDTEFRGNLLSKELNTLRTGAFKLFKCTFPGSKQFKSTFILCFFKNL